MKLMWKVSIAIAVVAFAGVATSRLIDDGGFGAVLKDEVPALVNQWGWNGGSQAVLYAAYIPAGMAVIVGLRAGPADYNKDEKFEELTKGISFEFWDEIMRNDNLAAAMRARQRQIMRVALDNTEQHFHDLFPEWWASQTGCMTPDEELQTIRQLAPKISEQIDTKNVEFERLAAKEGNGTLTVAERAAYLADHLRVPHLVQLPATSMQLTGNWIEVDPSEAFSRHESEGSLIRMCPSGDYSQGPHIKSCFGYVNINLSTHLGQSTGYGHHAPTVLGREVYRNLEQSNGTRDFVLQVMEDKSAQDALYTRAEEIVSNLPAAQVSSGSERWRVRSEYERLRCSK